MDDTKFWKYHIVKVSRDFFYMSTNVDRKHMMIAPAPSYFVKYESFAGSAGYKITLNQSHSKTSPITIEKREDVLIVSLKPCEYVGKDGHIANSPKEATNSLIQYKFVQIKSRKMLGDAVQILNGYSFDHCVVSELKPTSSGFLGSKKKLDGVKLGKDGSTYFILDKGSSSSWYENVYAFFRPCNREMSSKLTKSVLKSSKLMSSPSPTLSMKNFSVNEQQPGDDVMVEEEEEEENNSGDISYYSSHDGLFSRHPVDDSPNDFKFGWLSIYNKGDYFAKPGNYQLVLAVSLAVSIESNVDKFVNI